MSDNHPFTRFYFLLLDEIALIISFVLSCLIRKAAGLFYYDKIYIYVVIVIAFLQLLITMFSDGYKNVISGGYYILLIETFKSISIVTAFVILFMFLTQTSSAFSRIALGLFWLIAILIMYISRISLRIIIKKNSVLNKKSLVLVGRRNDLEKAVKNLRENKENNYEIKGLIVTDEQKARKIQKICIIKDFKEYARTNSIDDVLFFSEENSIYNSCVQMGLTIHNVVLNNSISPSKVYIDEFEGYGVITRKIYNESSYKMLVKRLADVFVSIIGTFLLIIITIIIGPIIFISNPGPIFFKQIRVGKNGKRFKLYKFRSMYKNADSIKNKLLKDNEMQGLMFKMENDPRIIKGIGGFIRKTSIDEFPQFINVLKGDMSVVGTRPPTEDEYQKYEYHHMRRLSIKPGITGLWQISGRNEITDFEKVVELDNKYIDNWSLGLDLKIILKTIYVVLVRKGAR